MDFVVEPAALIGGTVTVPGDKSISHRALMLGAIANGTTRIRGFLAGEDCIATMNALRAMGVEITAADEVTVQGVGRHGLRQPAQPLDLGNSGTGLRLLAGLLCGQDFSAKLTGDRSLCSRPMERIIRPLERMGARIESREGKPPLRVHGRRRLAGVDYELPIASAQVKSAILLAGLYAAGEVVVTEPAVTRNHTERMLRTMGVELETAGGCIRMQGGQALHARDLEVPADLSSAAFLVLAALLAPDCELIVERVGVNPTRTGFIEILREMGADIALEQPWLAGDEPVADLRVRSSTLHGIDVDPALVSLAIDEFPALFVAASQARGRTRFCGLAELRVKESDRIAVMADGLRRLGIRVDETPDGAVVHAGALSGGAVESAGDHRVAMSFAVAGTIAASPVRVHDADTVATSFPGFVGLMQSVGVRISAVEAA